MQSEQVLESFNSQNFCILEITLRDLREEILKAFRRFKNSETLKISFNTYLKNSRESSKEYENDEQPQTMIDKTDKN